MQSNDERKQRGGVSRRHIIRGAAAAAAGGSFLAGAACKTAGAPGLGGRRLKGNINHSVVSWPFQVFGEEWELPELCRVATRLGAKSVELVGPEGWEELARLAERHNIEIHLEHLNSRVEGDSFRGHPGYQGDHVDYGVDILRRVGSEKVKLLFDVYVGHEFIPTRDPIKGLCEAIAVCDV